MFFNPKTKGSIVDFNSELDFFALLDKGGRAQVIAWANDRPERITAVVNDRRFYDVITLFDLGKLLRTSGYDARVAAAVAKHKAWMEITAWAKLVFIQRQEVVLPDLILSIVEDNEALFDVVLGAISTITHSHSITKGILDAVYTRTDVYNTPRSQ